MKMDQLEKFHNQYAYSKPKVTHSEFKELTERKYKSGALCGPKSTNLCILANLGQSDLMMNQLNSIVKQFEYDPVEFAFTNEQDHPHLF